MENLLGRRSRLIIKLANFLKKGPDVCFGPAVYKERNKVERFVNRFTNFRQIATRYDKRAISYQAWLTLAAIVLWL